MKVRELVAWLKERKASEVVHLGAMVASREHYDCPAVTFEGYAEAQDALRHIEDGLRGSHTGWKGGEYRYDLDSPVYFNPKFGTCGFELSVEALDAFLWGVAAERARMAAQPGAELVSLIERLPGDVVLSREDADCVRRSLEIVRLDAGMDDAHRIDRVLALLRGRR